MLLNEILDIENTKHILGQSGSKSSGTLPSSGVKFKIMGRGVDAVVYKTSDSPSVIKVVSVPAHEGYIDPYGAFIEQLADATNSNPMLPRISKIENLEPSEAEQQWLYDQTYQNKYDTRTKRIILRCYKMEKLFQLTDLEEEELEALCRSTFTEEAITGELGSYSIISAGAYIGLIVRFTKSTIYSPNAGELSLWLYPDLIKQAASFIETACKKSDGFKDIHKDNIMVRRTSKGYQLVITDPLSKN